MNKTDRTRRSTSTKLVQLLAAVALMATYVGGAGAPITVAGTSCAVYASTVSTDGVKVWGTATIDCTGRTVFTETIQGEVIETLGPLAFTRASCQVIANSTGKIKCTTTYVCNGSGTDEYFIKARGKDSAGNWSVWINGPKRTLTC
jgi:hypothetical protein